MKRIYILSTAIAAIGYSHGRMETVNVTVGSGKNPVRVNKADFDEDQAKPAGERQYKAYKGDENGAAASAKSSDVNLTGQGDGGEILTTAAPSAPNFNGPDNDGPLIDESKNAVAPTHTTVDQWLVMRAPGKNGKYFIADGLGAKITGDAAKLAGIDENGYDTEDAARHVINHTSR